MSRNQLPTTSSESAQSYLDESFNHAEWHTGGPLETHVVDSTGRCIGDFSRNARPRDEQRANAARAALCKDALAGVPSALLECLNPGDLLIALRYFGLPVQLQGGELCYFDDGDWIGLGADEAAVRRVKSIVDALPVPEDVLSVRLPVGRAA